MEKEERLFLKSGDMCWCVILFRRALFFFSFDENDENIDLGKDFNGNQQRIKDKRGDERNKKEYPS